MNHPLSLLFLLFFGPHCIGASIGVPEGMMESVISIKGNKVSGDYGRLAQCISSKSSLHFEWNIHPTQRLLNMIYINKIDMIYPMGFTKQRNKIATPSKSLYFSQDIWVYTGTKPNFKNLNLSIAVKSASPQETSAKEMGYKNVVTLGYNSMLKMLKANRVRAVILPVRLFNELNNGDSNYFTENLLKRHVGFYLSKDFAKENLAAINQAIDDCLLLKID